MTTDSARSAGSGMSALRLGGDREYRPAERKADAGAHECALERRGGAAQRLDGPGLQVDVTAGAAGQLASRDHEGEEDRVPIAGEDWMKPRSPQQAHHVPP